MIRPMRPTEVDTVAEIWLQSNLQAHDFIPAAYWQVHFSAVREQLAQAEVHVCEEDGELLGFLGLQGEYLAGIFVRQEARSRGVGRQLLDAAKRSRRRLTLHVYERNARAMRFYQREGFRRVGADRDPDTGEREWEMAWG